eukprot:1393467-Amorphochlora_amoeboformis.AAC.3
MEALTFLMVAVTVPQRAEGAIRNPLSGKMESFSAIQMGSTRWLLEGADSIVAPSRRSREKSSVFDGPRHVVRRASALRGQLDALLEVNSTVGDKECKGCFFRGVWV